MDNPVHVPSAACGPSVDKILMGVVKDNPVHKPSVVSAPSLDKVLMGVATAAPINDGTTADSTPMKPTVAVDKSPWAVQRLWTENSERESEHKDRTGVTVEPATPPAVSLREKVWVRRRKGSLYRPAMMTLTAEEMRIEQTKPKSFVCSTADVREVTPRPRLLQIDVALATCTGTLQLRLQTTEAMDRCVKGIQKTRPTLVAAQRA